MGGAIGVTKARLQLTKDTRKIELIKRQKNQISSLASWAAKEARIALLQLIPIIGAQLANQYRMSGSLKGFVDAPAFGGLLAKIGLTIPKIVYGFRKHDSFPGPSLWSLHAERNYLNDRMPSFEMTKAHLNSSEDTEVLVRIPVVKGEKFVRYHDGTMLFPEGSKDIRNKTVILYHGNGEHRDNMGKTLIEYLGFEGKNGTDYYLDRGYNVLLAAYAGDTVVQGTGDSYTIQSTKCSEQYMREDAEADLNFLNELGVKNVAVHGRSLGGAQAMNFAQSVQNSENLSLDFVLLEKTFTNMVDAAGNFLRNRLHSHFLAKITSALTRKFVLEEGGDEGCDGLDNEKKLFELSRNQKFANTKFCILGAANDTIMGNPSFPPDNFATKLHKAVHNKDQVHFELQFGEHNSPSSLEDAMRFLFPSKIREHNPDVPVDEMRCPKNPF
jgi:hypothetical protein